MRDRAERKTGKPRRNSANFCGIRRTRRLLSTRGKLPKSPSIQGFKGKPEFRLNRRATALQQAHGGENPSRKNSARKKPEASLAEKLSGEPLKKPRAEPRKALPRQTQIKSPPRKSAPCAIGWRCRTPSRTRFPSAGSRMNERAPPIPLRRGLCPCGRLPIRRRAGRCSRCR